MSLKIKAIQTRYAGRHFRSRLEARYAVLFDALGVKWEYEKEGLITPYGWYLPDFYIPKTRWFIEVKGTSPNKTDENKSLYVDCNPPEYATGLTTVIGDPIVDYPFVNMVLGVDVEIEDIDYAIQKALSARFEHGESGA